MSILDYNKYANTARTVIGEGCVLLKNDNNVLPIGSQEKVSIFGRMQCDSYYCGTGSGGMVNAPYVVDILTGLQRQCSVNEQLVQIYKQWISAHPFDQGSGWAQEPWSQQEMPLTLSMVNNARELSNIALVVIGRSAGEDKDSAPTKGSYYLSDIEQDNLQMICEVFDKVVVLLNCGNIMDMSWVAHYNPSAVMCAWHGGSESGNGYADVLCGKVNPSGRLTDSIAKSLDAYPSTANFGGKDVNVYQEDIFVGYRYFETFAPQDVLYPFGFGLSYTTFAVDSCAVCSIDGGHKLTVTVNNIGDLAGKQTVQVYVRAPQGVLGKAERVLVGFAKTDIIQPHDSATVEIIVNSRHYASYDEQGLTGNQSCYVLEAGCYSFYVGFDVREATEQYSFVIDDNIVVRQCSRALAPIVPFDRVVATVVDDQLSAIMCPAYVGSNDRPSAMYSVGHHHAIADTHYCFADVVSGKATALQLASQLTDHQLLHMSRGEGMCSPKVTSGTAGCLGGVTPQLSEWGIPIACCADGPSGIRMDCGTMAFSLPNGALIASTYNTMLTTELFEYLALEMVKNNIDTILGPGMNIHRNPLCGRNFEYFSEDPYLAGAICVAELNALHRHGVTGTLKHFACNNQENNRKYVDAIVSERALREIYLKAFEMAVVDGAACSIMTAYNPINGWQSASNYSLTTTILRGEWGYDGIVMTDWWAGMNNSIGDYSESDIASMIKCQNDVYMVNGNAFANSNDDNGELSIANGDLLRSDLVRNGSNIISFLTKVNCASDYASASNLQVINQPNANARTVCHIGTVAVDGHADIDLQGFVSQRGMSSQYILHCAHKGRYTVSMQLSCSASSTAQVSMTISANGIHAKTVTLQGGTSVAEQCTFDVFTNIDTYLEFYFKESGINIHCLSVSIV